MRYNAVICKFIMINLIVFLSSYARLSSGKDTLVFLEGLNFDSISHKVTCLESFDSLCSKPTDLFYRTTDMCPATMGYNCGFRICSWNNFFLSKKSFGEAVFKETVNITDTTVFKNATLIDKSFNEECEKRYNFYQPASQSLHYDTFEPYFFIIKSQSQNYVLFKIKSIPIYGERLQYSPTTPVTEQIEVTWFIQMNGSLNFDGVKDFSLIARNIKAKRLISNSNLTNSTFNLQGQKITIAQNHKGLSISRFNDATCKLYTNLK